MSANPPPTVLELAASPKTAEMLVAARSKLVGTYSELAEDPHDPRAANYADKHVEPILQRLWQGVGTPPICTRTELRAILFECVTLRYLHDDRIGECLTHQLRQLFLVDLQPRLTRLQGNAYTYRDVQVADGESLLRLNDTNGAVWQADLVWVRGDPRWNFPDLMLRCVASGVSPGAFEAFAEEASRAGKTLWNILQATRENALTEPTPWGELTKPADHESFRQCLDVLLRPPSKKNQLKRRLRNAIALMTEAEHARHSAVSLALWCAAVEALVCKKGGDVGISEALASNVATMLQPDPERRLDAMKRVKVLYGGRSDLVHGNTVEEQPALSRDARLLAAGVFRATMEWMRENGRIDESTVENTIAEAEFFDSIRRIDKTGRAMPGVPSYLVECLPPDRSK
jgi:hypothetical protein